MWSNESIEDPRDLEPEADAPRHFSEHILRDPVSECGPRAVVSVAPETTVADAVALMREQRIGCVVVERDGRLAGIFTERDVLLRVVARQCDPARTTVGEVMTPDPEAISMQDEFAWVLNLMAAGGFRHVPVVDADGRPVAIFSVRHVVERLVDFFPQDVLTLPPHPRKNIARTREGA